MPTWEPIEGETPIDPSYLKDKSIKTRAQLNIAEAENILKPIVKYLGAKPTKKLAPFDLKWFMQLHEEMFCDVWEYAGKFRREDLNIGSKWQNVQTELYKLEGDIAHWVKNAIYETLELAVRLHYQAVYIHPFPNGNGRWARLLGNIFLKQHDHPIVKWPEQTIGVEKSIARDAYLSAIKKADTGDLSELINLHKKYLDEQN
ncbi:MAG: mobile mystery protein B [Pirellulaceae bacterium]